MVSLLMGGSIDSIKSMAIISAPPLIILYCILFICLIKWLRQDFKTVPSILERDKTNDKENDKENEHN